MEGERRDDRTDRGAGALDATICASVGELAAPVSHPPRSVPEPRPSERGQQSVTARFVRQHEELSTVGKELVRHLDSTKIAEDPSGVRRLLASFSGKLRVHAAMEQEALYPRLLGSADLAIRDKAQELLDEVGSIYELFFKHLTKWSEAAAIKADAEGFCRETMQLLHRLKIRMKRENEELYPMVDAPA